MAEMQVNKQSVREFLASGKSFLVPEYQRPYSWKQEQCETLWEDIMNFFKNTQENQDSSDDEEYFLGSVVSFIDENNKKIAIQKAKKEDEGSIAFYNNQKIISVRWNNKELLKTVAGMMEWNLSGTVYKVDGDYIAEEEAMIFDLKKAEKTSSK